MQNATPELLKLLHLDGPPTNTSETLWARVALPLSRAITETWPRSRPHDPVGKRLDLIVRVVLNIEPDPVYFLLDLGKRQAAVGAVFDLQARQIRKYQKEGLEQLARVLEERSPPPLSHKEVGEYLDHVAKEQHLATLFRTATRPRSAVHDSRRSESASSRPSNGSPRPDDLFVPRDDLHALVTAAVGRAESSPGPAIIYLHGEPGTGKTAYLRALFTSLGGGPWLDLRSDEGLRRSLLPMLEQRKLAAETDSVPVLLDKFLRFVAAPDGPKLVVLDGVQDADLLERLAAIDASLTVLATGRSKLPALNAEHVLVGDMSLAQASSFMRKLAPAVAQQDAERLAIALGCRPRLIANSASFVRETPTRQGIDDLCDVIARDEAVAVDAFEEDVDERLTGLYRRLLERLATDEPDALAVLEMMAFGPHIGVPPELVMSYLLHRPFIRRADIRFAEMAYRRALGPLAKSALVTVDRDNTLSISQLTQGILMSLLWGRQFAVYERIEQALEEPNSDCYTTELYEEGWFALSVSGRLLYRQVFVPRVATFGDQRYASSTPSLDPVERKYAVEALRERYLKIELMRCIANGSLPLTDDGDWNQAKLVADAAERPRIQSHEMLWCLAAVQVRSPEKPDGRTVSGEDFARAFAGLIMQHVESPYGPVDTGSFEAGLHEDEVENFVTKIARLTTAALAGPLDEPLTSD